jgi:hypothetical protein
MDILAHGVYNIALQKTIRKDADTKKKVVESFWWGIAPDLLAFGIPFLLMVFTGSFDHHVAVNGMNIPKVVYPFTHSLVIFSSVFIFIRLVTKKWYLPMLGWGLHVLMDMPLHTPEFYPTPFLFPLSSYTLPFGISWGTPLLWGGLWLLVIIWLSVLYYKKRVTKNV